MKIDEGVKAGILGKAALTLLPELIREAMVEDPAVLQSFQLTRNPDGTVAFAEGPKFLTSVLSGAVADASATSNIVPVKDLADIEWSVSMELEASGVWFATITDGDRRYGYAHAGLLVNDATARIASFRRMAEGVALPREDRRHWEEVLVARPLTNAELESLHEELENTPSKFVMRFRDALRRGDVRSDDFIPQSVTYYERLIGKLGGAITVQEHAEQGARHRIQELLAWDAKDGLLFSLPLAAHSALSSGVRLYDLNPEIVMRVFETLLTGDSISQIGAIEAAIPVLDKRPEFVGPVSDLVDLIRESDPGSSGSDFFGLSRLFVFVDSELSRLGILKGRPPFYRRLAALTQASSFNGN